MTVSPPISILIHIYYPDTYKNLIERLLFFSGRNVQLLVNICSDTPNKDKIIAAFKTEFPSSFFISTDNIGKDIGGKLALYAFMEHLKISSEWLLLLHDKKSPQSVNGDEWRDELYKIFDQRHIGKAKKFMDEKDTGIIGSRKFIVTYNAKQKELKSDPNFVLLNELAKQFELNKLEFSYVGGTVFWIRKKILDHFFQKEQALEIRRGLEGGNVMDNHQAKHTHTWERMFGLIAVNQGFKLKGI